MKKKNVKLTKEKGITLIALVITIVVLLILASVSITVLFGDSGIIKMAQEAADKTNEAVKKDQDDIKELEKILEDEKEQPRIITITFIDGYNGGIFNNKAVREDFNEEELKSAITPPDHSSEGYTFSKWTKTTDKDGNITYTAEYEAIPPVTPVDPEGPDVPDPVDPENPDVPDPVDPEDPDVPL